MSLPQSTIDLIATQILVEVQGAIKSLRDFESSTLSAGQKIQSLKGIIESIASQAGVSLDKAAQMFELLAGKLTNVEKKALATALALAKVNAAANIQGANPLYSKEQEKQANESYDNFVKQTMVAAEFQDKKDMWFEKDAANQDKLFEQTRESYAKEEQAAADFQKQKEAWFAKDIANQDKAFENTLAGYKSLEQAVPRVATQNFGDINAYIAQATNKVQAWKGVIQSVMRETGGSVEAVGAQLKKMVSGASIAPLNKAVKELGGNFENAAKKSKYSIDVIRTALGVLTAMLVNTVLTAFMNFFKETIQGARDLEDSLWRLSVAEQNLSKFGADISLQGLEDGITRIQKLLPIFSREDISQLVGDVAVSTQQLGFTEKQIIDLAEAIAYLNIKSVKNEDIMTTSGHVMAAMLGKNSTGIAALGISFNEMAMKEQAARMGIIKQGDSLEGLSDDTRAQIKLQILLNGSVGDTSDAEARTAALDSISRYLETNTAKIKENTAAWNDLKVMIGQGWIELIPDLAPWITEIQKSLEASGLSALFEKGVALQPKADSFSKFAERAKMDAEIIKKLRDNIALTADEMFRLKEILDGLSDEEILKIFPDPSSIKNEQVQAIIKSVIELDDTATELPDPLIPTQEETDAFNNLADDLAEVASEAAAAYEELERVSRQKAIEIHADLIIDLEDIETDFARELEDIERDLQYTLQDIAIDTQNKISDLKTQAREDEMRAELEFQQKMRELRQQFMMDLDDALHARDARQVLGLIKQYELEKQQALERKKLDDKLRAEKLAADIRAAQVEEQRRIAEAQREAARKAQEAEIEKEREIADAYEKEKRKLDDLKEWNRLEAEEIERHAEEKNLKLKDAYEKAVGIHSSYEKQINDLIEGYSADNIAAIDALYAHMAGVYASISQMYANSQAMIGAVGAATPPPVYQYGGGSYAEGGTVIANKPTVALFGEKGLEMATFTPLNRIGSNVNDVFSNLSGGGGVGGKISIEMLLSPDLEARVIRNSLSKTAEVIARVARSK